MRLAARLGFAALLVLAGAARAADVPYKNTALPFKERVADMISRMTLDEKAAQVQMTPPAISRLGIPAACWWSEAIHGLSRADASTNFPAAIGMSASWDPPLLHSVADAISDEARAMYRPGIRYFGLTLWCPTINMARDPRWGRVQETYGEDPILTSRLAVEFVQGLQGDDPQYFKTVATPKHFAAHSQETGRFNTSFDVSERDLREYYLPAFHACFTEGHAMSLMTAHSGVNGIPCMVNGRLLTDILRDEWGFQGAAVTDWNAVSYLINNHKYVKDSEHVVAASLKAGVDVLCNGDDQKQAVLNAIQQNLMTEKDLDNALVHNLLVRMRLGMFDPAIMEKFAKPKSVIGSKEHADLALKAARESMVLLQNNPGKPGYGFDKLLPLDLRRVRSLAVIGPFTETFNSGDYTPKTVIPPVSALEGLRAAVGPRVRIATADWGDEPATLDAARNSDVAIVLMGHAEADAREGVDLQSLALPRLNTLQKIVTANPNVILVLETCNSIDLTWVKDNVPAVLLAWFPGQAGGTAIADTITGRNNPAGRLPITFYRGIEDLPPLSDYDIQKGRTYMYVEKPISFPFGHGLSYTTFTYSNLKIAPAPSIPQPTTQNLELGTRNLQVTVNISNTGPLDGDEVVQLYLHKSKEGTKRPLKQLKAFTRATIPAGQSKTLTLQVPYADLTYWDDTTKKMTFEPGAYDIMIGASSTDIRLQSTISLR